jgi:hypothetical protein
MLDSSAILIRTVIADIAELTARGFGRREIARRTGLASSTVYGIQRGQHGISAARAAQVVARQMTYRSLRSVKLPDGSVVTGEPATARDSKAIADFGNAYQQALRGNISALDKPEFQRPVTLITADGRRVRVRLPTDPAFIREMGERDEDIVEFQESETP